MRRRASRFTAAGLILLFFFTAGDFAWAYTGILSFGDSLSDNGTTVLNGIADDNYGFRRYSNGPVWVEYLAASRSLPLLDMAYGGATSGYDNPAAYSALKDPYYLGNTGLLWQLGQYASTHPAGIPQGTLITLWAGGNDMFNNRPALGAATNIAAAIQILYNLGGRDFIVPNLAYSSTDPYQAWKAAFDQQLAFALAALDQAYPDLNLVALDLNFLEPLCDFRTGTWMAQTYGPGVYYSYDGVHPTTEIHQQIAGYASAAAVPLPPTFYLLLSGLAGLTGYMRMRFRR